jgi:acyl CoA:acetate/3-ketoacid CoA transferase beta subunit
MHQTASRFLEKVPFVTAPGDRIRTLVSSLGVFEKPERENTFTLTRVFVADEKEDPRDTVEKIRAGCGWPLQVADSLQKMASPALDELRLLRVFDPRRFYLK